MTHDQTTINNFNAPNEHDVIITLKRGARGGYAWEITIKGSHEKEISPRITTVNAAYLKLYGANDYKLPEERSEA